MKKFCSFCRSFADIQWNSISVLICATPIVLLFVLVHLSIFTFDETTGAVVSNHRPCVQIGEDFLRDGGSAVDAAIGMMICEGVNLPNRAGLGGGFTAIVYHGGRVNSLTATPIVPQNFPEGFLDPTGIDVEGAKSGGVPGELLGYWELHKRYGLLSWKSLFEPTIRLCKKGIPVSDWLDDDIERSTFYMYKSKTMRELYRILQTQQENNSFKLLKLADTLKIIAENGPNEFYNGELGKKFVRDVQSEGGYITEKDLRNYKVVWSSEPIVFHLPTKLRAYTTPLPSMGAVVAMTMNIVKSLGHQGTPLFWHKVIESMKHALGRSTQLSDIENETNKSITKDVKRAYKHMIDSHYANYIRKLIHLNKTFHDQVYYGMKSQPRQMHGTSNICVLSPDGDAIVMTSSLMWDSKTFFWSPSTGIVVNSLMRSFLPHNNMPELSLPYGEYVKPGKRALTPHCPVIVVNKYKANVNFLVGASGSALIPSQVITALIHYVLLKKNAYTAANSGVLAPDVVEDIVHIMDGISKEVDFEEGLLAYLAKCGHNLREDDHSNRNIIRTCIGRSSRSPDAQFTNRQHGFGVLVEPQMAVNMFAVVLLLIVGIFVVIILVVEIRRMIT